METFVFSEDLILENERVLLRPLHWSDLDNLLDFALNEPEIWKYSLVPVAGKDNLLQYIHQALEARAAGKEYPFVVFDKVKQRYAGSTRFYDIQLSNKSLQLGYTWYGQKFQRTGLNRHCKYLLLSFAFENIGMERVEFRADNNNTKSIAAMIGIGCKVDGVLRANMPKREGGRRDSIVLSILKDEWFGGVKEMLWEKLKC